MGIKRNDYVMAGADRDCSILDQLNRCSFDVQRAFGNVVDAGILGMLLMISAFIIGVQFDITTLTMLYFFANVVNFIPAMTITMRLLEGSLFEVLARLIGPHFVQESCARHCIGCNTLHRWVSPSIISSR